MAAFGRLCAFFGEIPAFGRGEKMKYLPIVGMKYCLAAA